MNKIDYSYYERRIKLHELEASNNENRAKMLDIYHSLWYDYLTELRYNHNHDSKGRFCSGGGSGVYDNVHISGAISGGLNPDSKEAREHADRYYESVRHMSNDVDRIAENTGFDKSEISEIKNFVFMEKHDLGDGKLKYFYPDYKMAQSWQRLIDGKDIQPHDITLLKHETMERKLMKQGLSQEAAHRKTEETYNYAKESGEYYAKINKHKN